MPREFSRSARVASQLQRELADLIRSELKDPRIGMVSIHDVKVNRDLSAAQVYVGVLEGEAAARANVKALNQAAHYLRKELGRRLHMRIIPELRFVYDDSIERGMRLTQLLGRIAQDQTTPAAETTE